MTDDLRRAPRFTLPAPVAWVVARLPAGPPAFLLARALDAGVGRIVPRDAVAPLQGKRFALTVRDLGLTMHVDSPVAGGRPRLRAPLSALPHRARMPGERGRRWYAALPVGPRAR